MKTIVRNQTINVSISLPKDIKQKADEYAKKNELTLSQLVRQALKSTILKPQSSGNSSALKKFIGSLKNNVHTDPVKWQRKIRKEWDRRAK